jgi:hypothetical protein
MGSLIALLSLLYYLLIISFNDTLNLGQNVTGIGSKCYRNWVKMLQELAKTLQELGQNVTGMGQNVTGIRGQNVTGTMGQNVTGTMGQNVTENGSKCYRNFKKRDLMNRNIHGRIRLC